MTTSTHLSDEERHLRGTAAFVLPHLVMIGAQHHLKVMVRRIQRTSNWVVSTTTFAIGCEVKSTKRAKNTTAAFARSGIIRWITSIAGWRKFLPEEISKPSANTLSLACTASLRTSR